MATIKQIADLAGVSRGTVDRVLNKRGAVNPQTEKKILEIAKALDYRPNRAGIVLAAQKKRLKLAVILFGEGNPFFDEVVKGVEEKAADLSRYNCTVMLKRVALNTDSILQAIDECVLEQVNGIALSPTNDSALAKKINELSNMGISVVTLNTDIQNCNRLAYVGCNFYHSGETAAGLMRLMSHGEVNVGIVTGSNSVLCHTERIAGFTNCIKERYPNIHITDTIVNEDDDFISYDLTCKLLTNHPEINALFFTASGAYGGCRAVLAMNRTKDMTIITYDKTDGIREMLANNVISATICQQPSLQGRKPLDILFTYLATGELPEQELNYTAVDIRIRENV